eukprot:gb/GECG01014808.1/.p1 GENE.gb/GECG01014808.1/~~gb/GECG01014808.1/.p1  ORF type:complete len:465 (+),score=43.75 gb/GECG01014808.1/:1-1395(+)
MESMTRGTRTFGVHAVVLATVAAGFIFNDSTVSAESSPPASASQYLRFLNDDEDGALSNTGSIILTALIPFIAGITGWITNVMALHLTFYPLEFVGWYKPFLGWQGIIPSRAKEMAEISTDLIQQNLLRVHEVFDQLSPEEFADKSKPEMRRQMKDIIDRVAYNNVPEVWDRLPEGMKQDLYDSAVEQSPPYLANFIRNLQAEIEQIFDLKHMVVKTLTEDKELINQVFLTCGAPEFEFIKRSGFYFGFTFGLFQMLVWIFYSRPWVLPVFGFVVGWFTNYLALKVIFRPVDPVFLCGGRVKLHGLFLTRQHEVAENYSEIVQDKILGADNLIESLLHGPGKHEVSRLISENMSQAVDNYIGSGKSIISYTLGDKQYEFLKVDFAHQVNKALPALFMSMQDFMLESLHVKSTLQERMKNMSSKDFEQLLHPVFEQDEWKLILLGGVLGCAIGGVQAGLSIAATS